MSPSLIFIKLNNYMHTIVQERRKFGPLLQNSVTICSISNNNKLNFFNTNTRLERIYTRVQTSSYQ